jgi:hypothetical protein
MAARRALPARYPPHGAWPAVMRADMTAAFFDCPDTAELARQVSRGEAPKPTDLIGVGRGREPVWAREACVRFVAHRHGIGDDPGTEAENVADLV